MVLRALRGVVLV
jgi:hypothetical protein